MIEISVAVIAAAFVILTIFLVMTLVRLNSTLKEVDLTLFSVRSQLEQIGDETQKILGTTRQMTDEVYQKVQMVNAGFDILKKSCQTCSPLFKEWKNHRIQELSRQASEEKTEEIYERAQDILEIIRSCLNLWQKFNKRS